MDEKQRDIYYHSLMISDYGRKTISEKEIAKNISNINKNDVITIIEENKDAFNCAELKNDFCPECKKQLLDTKKGFCGGCGANVDLNDINQYRIDIDKTGFKNKLIETTVKSFESDGWIVENSNSNLSLLKKDEYYIAIFYSLDDSSLKEYYYLRGWLQSTKNVCYLLITKANGIELLNFASKDPNIILYSTEDIFLEHKTSFLLSKVNYCLENIKQESIFEDVIKGTFQEELDIRQLQIELKNILSDLNDFALHNNNLSNPKNGYRYQSSIIKLFNLTFLPIKVLAKQDIQDVLVRVPQNYGVSGKQLRWIPLEIKSFRPKSNDEPYFNLKEYSSQFRKYIGGYLNPDVLSMVQVECFIVFAFDFILDQENISIIDEIEKDFDNKIHISLFPQKSLIYLLSERMNHKNPIRNFDHIIDLFKNNRYIDKKQIDEFYEKIDIDFKSSGEETILDNVQKIVHKKGK